MNKLKVGDVSLELVGEKQHVEASEQQLDSVIAIRHVAALTR